MKKLARTLLTLCVVGLLAATLSAQEKDAKKAKAKGKRGAGNAIAQRMISFPKVIEATEEQTAKLEELRKEYGPQLTALMKQRREILTADQVKSQQEARKAAAAEGKKGKELQAAVAAAVEVTPEQKEKLAKVQKEQQELMTKVRKAMNDLLTEEQKAKLPKRAGGKKAAKKAKKAE